MPSIQFRFSIPLVVVVAIVGLTVIVAYGRVREYRDTIQFASGLVGGAVAIYALLLNVQTRRSTAASRFVERYNEPTFAELRKVLSKAISTPSHTLEPHSVRSLLNFFEEMAIAVNSKEADEKLARGFFFSISGKFYRALEGQIRDLREAGNQPTAFIEYEKMYRRWNKS
jgi:hypothetical protein